MARLVSELDVANLQRSLAFYVDVLGFTLAFERPEEKFARVAREGAELMLEEAAGPGRRFRTASLEYPFGRGINLQIEIDDVDVLHARVAAAGTAFVVPLEDRWYRRDADEYGKQQSSSPIRTATCCASFQASARGRFYNSKVPPRHQPTWAGLPATRRAKVASKESQRGGS